MLSDSGTEPLKWGWELKNSKFYPDVTDTEAGPPDLLKIVRCSCRGTCGSHCSCGKKSELKCADSCKVCHGISCSNAGSVSEIDINDDNDLDRNIFENIFNVS